MQAGSVERGVRGADTHAVAVWVLEDELTGQQQQFHLQDTVDGLDEALPEYRRPVVLRLLRVEEPALWRLRFNTGPGTISGLRGLQGQVSHITAFTIAYRQRPDRVWSPLPATAASYPVQSTSAPDPARGTWIPSGRPVLLGFLLTISGPQLSRLR